MSKTINVKVSEHKHLRGRCRKQFKFGLKIISFLLASFIVSLLIFPKAALFIFILFIIFSITTYLEYRNLQKHEHALKKIAKHS